MTEWNKEQKKVIDSRKLSGQILVSAAAGSGKTAVLVERIIMSLLDTEDGEYVNDIDDFLVVTFTRAAAAQMKDKITKEIGRYLDEESSKEYPDIKKMEHLMRQQIAVGRADICTLDSFSGKVVRENFNLINIDPGFTTIDGNMMKLVKDDILDDMFDSLFSGIDGKYVKAEDFSLLAKVFFRKTDEQDLKRLFYKITSVADTMPEPAVWLEECRICEDAVAGNAAGTGGTDSGEAGQNGSGNAVSAREKKFNSLPWVRKTMDYIKGRMSSIIGVNDLALAIADKQQSMAQESGIDADIKRTAKQMTKLLEDREVLQKLYDNADVSKGGSFSLFLKAFSEKKFARNDKKTDDELVTQLRSVYSKSDGELSSFVNELFGTKKLPDCEAIYRDIFDNAAKWINIMVDFCLEFMERVMVEKHRMKQYEFGDISHFALQILTQSEGAQGCQIKRIARDERGNVIPSKAARALALRYKYIYIDEYQDSSYIQEDMINAIARFRDGVPTNIFMVGDVKQSIYKFRQASPKLFVDKYNSFRDITGDEISDMEDASPEAGKSSGMLINLSTNYRSRRPVLDAVNRIFRDLMKRDLGGIDYDENASLRYGAGSVGVYEDKDDAKVTLTIITKPMPAEEAPEADIEEGGVSASEDNGAAGEGSQAGSGAVAAEGSQAGMSTTIDNITQAANSVVPGKSSQAESDSQDDDDEDDPASGDFNNDEYEAAYVADKISQILSDENYMVYSKEEGMHRVRPSDIVILTRSIVRRADYYVDALSRRNIAVSLDNRSGYFDAAETVTMLSMLKVIDNRKQDIPLAAVLNSPIGGLSNSDLMMIAGDGNYKTFYDACEGFIEKYCSENAEQNEKCKVIAARLKKFFDMVDDLADKQRFMSISMLIRRIMELTDYDIYASALPMGQRRLANLNMLMLRADEYEKSCFSGLFNFLRYIDKCRIHDIDFAEAEDDTTGSDKVTIMSIHKSKGLEFPVVFLVGLGHEFNKMDDSEDYFVDGDNHLAVNYLDPGRRVYSNSFMMKAFVRLSRLGRVEEEQRLLYVGMTRARERLYMTGVDRKYLTKPSQSLDYKTRSSLNTYLTWIEPVISRDQGENIETSVVTFDDISGVAREAVTDKNDDYLKLMMSLEKASALENVRKKAEEIEEIYNLDKNYKYKQDVTTRAKMSVTGIKKKLNELADEETERYAGEEYDESRYDQTRYDETGTESTGYTAARRGTLVHKIFELIDFKKVSSASDMKKEAEKAIADPYFTDDDRIDIMGSNDMSKIGRFAETELFRKMKAADERGQLFKEAEFTMGVPTGRLIKFEEENLQRKSDGRIIGSTGYDESKADEDIVIIQGIIDGYYIDTDGRAVIMDYKTDRTRKKEELIKHHGEQLKLYSDALSGIRGLDVKKLVIYSLKIGEVEVE